MDLAFPLTAGSATSDRSLADRDTFDQPTIEERLKDEIRASQGWQAAHQAGYSGLPVGVPMAVGIVAKIAEQFTGIPVSNWVTMWLANPVVTNVETVMQDALAKFFTASANIQALLGSLDFNDPAFDPAAAAAQFADL